MEAMFRRTLGLLLLAAGLLPSCNTSMLDRPAPRLVGTEWVLPQGGEAPAVESGSWRVLAFFAPT